MRISDLNIDRIYANCMTRSADYQMAENHFHYYYELYFVRKGYCRVFLNDTLFDLYGGDFLIIPPREVHFIRYMSTCTRMNIYFTMEDILFGGTPLPSDTFERYLETPQLIHIPGAYQSVLDPILDAMLHEEKVDDASSGKLLRLMLLQCFLIFDRYCTFEGTRSVPEEKDQEIIDAAHYITEHYSQPLTLDTLADLAGLSGSYFSRKFRLVTGMGMKEYLNYVRLKNAAMELLSTNHSITEVALNCGFNDSNYFKDAFKKMYGLSPRAYRNSRSTDFILSENLREWNESHGQRHRHEKNAVQP